LPPPPKPASTRVGDTCKLGELEIDPQRRQAYARSAQRYAGARDTGFDRGQLEESLGEHIPPPDVWHVDLIEWEERGDAAEACADVVLDPDEESDRITRRTALRPPGGSGRRIRAAGPVGPRRVMVANYLAPIGSTR
jgi:hypothetical protein